MRAADPSMDSREVRDVFHQPASNPLRFTFQKVMAQFVYKARTMNGEPREGLIEVVNKDIAIDILKKSDLVIISIEEIKKAEGDTLARLIRLVGIGGKVKMREVAIFSRQFATLFDAKVPVVRSLKTLAAEAQNRTLQDTLSEILDDVSGGSSLSLAMSKHPNVFSYFYVSMVKAGEESGRLQSVFNYLADYMERTYDITAKVKNALVYPAFVLFVFVAVITMMLLFVVPNLITIFEESNAPVPFYTQIVF